MKNWILWGLGGALVLCAGGVLSIVNAGPAPVKSDPGAQRPVLTDGRVRSGDAELAYLLVKLELRTRAIIGGHYARSQSSMPGVDALYKRSLAKNLILPAAVADGIFAHVVPQATSGRAWVKMVVDEPRNPNNRADDVALALLDELRGGASTAQIHSGAAYYYAEPIVTNALCLRCHGEPAGAPDPSFPEYTKDGWQVDQIVGAVVSRVAPLVEPALGGG